VSEGEEESLVGVVADGARVGALVGGWYGERWDAGEEFGGLVEPWKS